ncbi:MAG: hypothetical protein WDM89_03035 [Rhizomicrobium sp.]
MYSTPANKNKVGTDQGYCVRVVVGKAFECIWTTMLAGGQITVEGPFLDAGELGPRRHRRHWRLCERARRNEASFPATQRGRRIRL